MAFLVLHLHHLQCQPGQLPLLLLGGTSLLWEVNPKLHPHIHNTLHRDFAAKMGIPRCGACDELIFSDEFVKAESQTWHTEHFACWLCDARLAGSEYVMLGLGQPACVSCWSASNRRTCAACGHDIRCFYKECLPPVTASEA